MEIKNPNWGNLVFWRYFWGDAETHQAAHWTCSPTGSDLRFWKFPSFSVPLRRSMRHREWIVTWTPSRTERDANGFQHPTALKPVLHGFQHLAACKPWPFVDSVTSNLCTQEFCVWTWYICSHYVATIHTSSTHSQVTLQRVGTTISFPPHSKTTKSLINITNTIQLFLHRDS